MKSTEFSNALDLVQKALFVIQVVRAHNEPDPLEKSALGTVVSDLDNARKVLGVLKKEAGGAANDTPRAMRIAAVIRRGDR